jgi:membrane-bound metal-dependent hydrolase YbcI (DUF457 family)
MGQVIAFRGKRSASHSVLTAERRAALITGLCALTYLLGFFIAGPMLAIYAFGFATTSHPLSAITCVAGLLAVWPITRFAYRRI